MICWEEANTKGPIQRLPAIGSHYKIECIGDCCQATKILTKIRIKLGINLSRVFAPAQSCYVQRLQCTLITSTGYETYLDSAQRHSSMRRKTRWVLFVALADTLFLQLPLTALCPQPEEYTLQQTLTITVKHVRFSRWTSLLGTNGYGSASLPCGPQLATTNAVTRGRRTYRSWADILTVLSHIKGMIIVVIHKQMFLLCAQCVWGEIALCTNIENCPSCHLILFS